MWGKWTYTLCAPLPCILPPCQHESLDINKINAYCCCTLDLLRYSIIVSKCRWYLWLVPSGLASGIGTGDTNHWPDDTTCGMYVQLPWWYLSILSDWPTTLLRVDSPSDFPTDHDRRWSVLESTHPFQSPWYPPSRQGSLRQVVWPKLSVVSMGSHASRSPPDVTASAGGLASHHTLGE